MKNKQLSAFVKPSWFVNFIGVATALLLTAGGIIASRYQGSQLQQELFENQANHTASTTTAFHTISANIANNSIVGTLPLLLTWSAVGLVIYFFAASIHQSLSQAVELRERLDYVHSSRQALIRQAMTGLIVRAVATVGFFVILKLTLAVFLPYVLASASLASRGLSLENVAYAILSLIVAYINIYVFAVLLRLIVLRPRLFSI